MWYAITGTDNPDSLTRRQSVRPAHLERLKQLEAEGRLLLAGPFPAIAAEDPGAAGFTGSLIVAAFDSLAAAKAWADADPYIPAGVYRDVSELVVAYVELDEGVCVLTNLVGPADDYAIGTAVEVEFDRSDGVGSLYRFRRRDETRR